MKNRDKKTDTFVERHMRALDALKDSEKRYRNLVDNSLVGIYQTNLKGDILYVNRALVDLLEFESPEELQRESAPVRYKNPEDRSVLIDILKKTGTITNYEVAILTKTGTTKNILLSAVLEEDKLSGMVMDITERKNMEEILKFKTTELKRSNEDLEYFASIVSHDLKEPLLSIGGYAQILGEKYKERLDNKALQYIDRIIAGTLRMEQLINELLAYSRVSTQAKAFSSVDWNVVLTKVRANLRQAIREHDALITADPLPALPGDETQCVQLIQNLVGNAIKYRDAEPPRIHISARRVEDVSYDIPQLESKHGWLFSVSDNGMSIPAEDNERIFELFHRLSTRGDQAGTGIGLAICKKIVERHGGRIWVESEPGRGSTFYFSLP